MYLRACLFSPALAAGMVLLAWPFSSLAQNPNTPSAAAADAELLDAPQPQPKVAAYVASVAEAQNGLDGQTPPAQQPAPAQQGSTSQSSPQQPTPAASQHAKAEEQVKEEEKQRVVGVLPAFNVSYVSNAVSLSPGQKMQLAFRSSIDWATFAGAFLVAGFHEATNSDPGFGWGIEGYGKRSGAAYLDSFDGTMIGNGILPSLLHQDPRYFRLGHGAFRRRLLYALATTVICKHDNTGKWEPNYSNVAGNVIAGGLSNLYYPSSNTGVGLTISNGLIVTAEGAASTVFDEFWPDISRRLFHRDPTHGLDALARARDAAEKQTGQNQK